MAPRPSQSNLIRLKLLLAYAVYYCLSVTISQQPDGASSSFDYVQALVYTKYQPGPLLSRVNRQPPANISTDSYHHNYQPQTHNRQQLPHQHQITYLTSSESNDESGAASNSCPSECHCNIISHIADCSDRNLTRVPVRFPKDIRRIRLERNNITEIGPFAFQNLKRLQRIDLSNNNLYKIDSLAFSGGLQALTTLILFNNKLEVLPANVFGELSNLQILLLNANSLQTIHKDLFQSLTDLQLLSLYDNNIVSLASGTFDSLKSVKTIHLGKNPLNCDCNLRWLVDYFETNPTVETSEARCSQPSRSQGKRLSQLDKAELKCQEPPPATNSGHSASKSPYGDQLASGSCPAGCICSGSLVDCSNVGSGVESPGNGGGIFELPDVSDDLPVYVARVHINDNRIKRIRQTGLFKKLINSQKLDLGNNKIVDVEDNAINGHLPNGQKPERVIFVLLENQHCESDNSKQTSPDSVQQSVSGSGTGSGSGSGHGSSSGPSTKSRQQQQQQQLSSIEEIRDACALAPKVNEPQFDSACYNGGQCKPTANSPTPSFTCQCPAGFGGPLCELNIDDCVDHQCQNGAMCVDGINSYKCICRDPTTSGEFCEQLNSNNLPFDLAAAAVSRPFGVSSNSIAPIALPIIAQNGANLQSNELSQSANIQQLKAAQQSQILARSADFMREEPISNSLQSQAQLRQSQTSGGKGSAFRESCHRITTSRYYDDGNGCQSVRLLKINECAGSCETKSGSGAATCCVATKIKRRRIHMQCGDGASYVKMVDLVKKCSCSQSESNLTGGNSCPANSSQLMSGPLETRKQQLKPMPMAESRGPTAYSSAGKQQYSKYSIGSTTSIGNWDQQTTLPTSRAPVQMGASGEQLISGGLDQEEQITRLDAVE